MMKEEQDIERLSYISEIKEIRDILKQIPPENVIDRVTFEGRLRKVQKEYEDKYPPPPIDDELWIALGYMDDEGVDCCDVCSNEKVACTCMGEDGMD